MSRMLMLTDTAYTRRYACQDIFTFHSLKDCLSSWILVTATGCSALLASSSIRQSFILFFMAGMLIYDLAYVAHV